ncbi:AAA family ATPase [Nonomuraea sp. MCN248]|uniref:AAA family ATPase n=1 Tax=Nonomuraea corallina TaxID=2989783 RepID=A0ABT4S7U8_9ACTN|nr:AAA family ATPase [Nonomuraea corallina]MDA0633244.1 AAA family ATPase [Nonomuraea corallina]
MYARYARYARSLPEPGRARDRAGFRLPRPVRVVFWVAVAVTLVAGGLLSGLFRTSPFVPFLLGLVVVAGAAVLVRLLLRDGVETYRPGSVATRFADVRGQDGVVERLQEHLARWREGGAIEEGGGSAPGGLLLWGPPGPGKARVAEAVAGETGKPYVVVDVRAFAAAPPAVGVLKVKALFMRLRTLALRHGGVVVLFDEADAPAGPVPGGGLSGCNGLAHLSEESRSALARPDAGAGMRRALISELSRLRRPRGRLRRLSAYRVLVIMTARRPDALDGALLRTGRVDRVHQAGHPSEAGRPRGVGRHAAAVHEACHAVVAYVTRARPEPGVATIEQGAGHLGGAAAARIEGRPARWKSGYEADVMVALASLAGERMFFGGDSSCDVSGDLHSATLLTALMESSWGMGSDVSSLPALRELGMDEDRRSLGERVERHLARLLEKTGDLLQEHRQDVLCLAHALETHRTLDGGDVAAILRRRPGRRVDGTGYASDAFVRELEEYHAEVVRAHQDHDRLDRDPPAVPRAGARPRGSAAGRGTGVGARPGAGIPLSEVGGPAGGRPAAYRGARSGAGGGPAFVPWGTPPQPDGAGQPPPEQGRGRWWVVVASAFTLVGLAVVLALSLNGVLTAGPAAGTETGAAAAPGPGVASPWLLVALFVVVVAVVVGAGLTTVAVKAMRAARAKADRERDEAHARAQFLAAALDPDTAMRLLGYDGGGRRELA